MIENFFSYFSTQKYVVGAQKNRPKQMFKLVSKKFFKYFTLRRYDNLDLFLNPNICCGYSYKPSQ